MEAISNIFENILAKLNIIKFLLLGCVDKAECWCQHANYNENYYKRAKNCVQAKNQAFIINTHRSNMWNMDTACVLPGLGSVQWCHGKQKWEISIKKSRV